MNKRPIFCKEEREPEESFAESCKELSEMLRKLCSFLYIKMAEESHMTEDKVDQIIRKMALSKKTKKFENSVYDKSKEAGLDPFLAMVCVDFISAGACLKVCSIKEMIT